MAILRRLFGGSPDTAGEAASPQWEVPGVVPIPPPPGWPCLPVLIPPPRENERIPVREQPYATAACPSCGVELNPPPKAKSRCRVCGNVILVRSGADNRRYLLSEAGLPAFERSVEEASTAQAAVDAKVREQLGAELERRMKAAGFYLGEADLDVAGTERHQRELAGIMAAVPPTGRRRYSSFTSAILVRDAAGGGRRPVRVVIHGLTVGYLEPEDASDMQRRLAAAEKTGRPYLVQAKLSGGWPDDRGRPAPLGVVLVDVPETW